MMHIIRSTFVALALVPSFAASSHATQPKQQSISISGIVSVFDGDTLEIGPLLIRLHGVDAPEKGQKCAANGGGNWSCGAAASGRLLELISSGPLTCDALDRDPYGRVIARCNAGNGDIGEILVRKGLAWAFTEYSEDYADHEAGVKNTGVGIWQADTQTASEFREDKWNRALATAPDGKCPIKGNISPGKDKLKIYHTPWSPNYGNTKINEASGERWFCDEAEALAAGWRPVAER